MKIINGFLFFNRKWADASSTAGCVNINQITSIGERNHEIIGRHVEICTTDGKEHVIDGYNNSEEFMIDFKKELDDYFLL